MTYDELLGRSVTLSIDRLQSPGAFLVPLGTPPGAPGVLLPRKEAPDDAKEGHEVAVFVYLDSEDRPIATVRPPLLERGEVAFLEVTDVTRFGAFVDWGLMKELLVPHREQTADVHVGERHPIGLYLDDTGRLAGTMRVSEMLDISGAYAPDQWVDGVAWRKEPDLGVFVILEKRFLGLLPASEPNALARGESARFRVANVLPDGKVELSLRGHAHEEVEGDANKILAALARPGAPLLGDHSSPEQIRALLGLSKKAFKRAAGRLLKERAVAIDGAGFLKLLPRRA
jgi:predicted RNA-binding protein (virulence factor B family)